MPTTTDAGADLLDDLKAVGIALELLDGGKLRATPAANLTDELRARIRENKAGLIALLTAGNASEAAGASGSDKVSVVQTPGNRRTTGILARPIPETEAGAGPHPADALGLQAVRDGVAGRASHLASDLCGDCASPAVEVGPDVPEEVGRLIDAGRAWRPSAWAGELRRRARLVSDKALSERMLQAADIIEAGLLK